MLVAYFFLKVEVLCNLSLVALIDFLFFYKENIYYFLILPGLLLFDAFVLGEKESL